MSKQFWVIGGEYQCVEFRKSSRGPLAYSGPIRATRKQTGLAGALIGEPFISHHPLFHRGQRAQPRRQHEAA